MAGLEFGFYWTTRGYPPPAPVAVLVVITLIYAHKILHGSQHVLGAKNSRLMICYVILCPQYHIIKAKTTSTTAGGIRELTVVHELAIRELFSYLLSRLSSHLLPYTITTFLNASNMPHMQHTKRTLSLLKKHYACKFAVSAAVCLCP